MLRTTETRRKAFKKALINAGMTAKQFATEQGVTDNHLYLVVSGARESERLLTEVDRFIEQHEDAA